MIVDSTLLSDNLQECAQREREKLHLNSVPSIVTTLTTAHWVEKSGFRGSRVHCTLSSLLAIDFKHKNEVVNVFIILGSQSPRKRHIITYKLQGKWGYFSLLGIGIKKIKCTGNHTAGSWSRGPRVVPRGIDYRLIRQF